MAGRDHMARPAVAPWGAVAVARRLADFDEHTGKHLPGRFPVTAHGDLTPTEFASTWTSNQPKAA